MDKFCEPTVQEWDDVCAACPESGFFQSWFWGELRKASGQQVCRLALRQDDGVMVAGAALYYVMSSQGPSALVVPHGPFMRTSDDEGMGARMLALMEQAALEREAPALRLEPFSAVLPKAMGDRFVRASRDSVPTPTRIIDLDIAEKELLCRMTPKGRYNVRLALRKGVVTKMEDTGSLGCFCDLFEATASRQGFNAEAPVFFERLFSILPSAMARLYISRYRGIPTAAAIVITFGGRATFLYGASSPFLGSLMSSYALHWHIMQDVRALGCREYDLFGIAPAGRAAHPYARFSRFKERLGGRVFSPVGAHERYYYPRIAQVVRGCLNEESMKGTG